MAKGKLNEIEKERIRELRREGLTYKVLAKQFDVSIQTILRICRPDIYEKQLASNNEHRKNNSGKIYQSRKASARSYKLEFHKTNDAEIIAQLEKQPNMQGYIKALIRRDIEKKR